MAGNKIGPIKIPELKQKQPKEERVLPETPRLNIPDLITETNDQFVVTVDAEKSQTNQL